MIKEMFLLLHRHTLKRITYFLVVFITMLAIDPFLTSVQKNSTEKAFRLLKEAKYEQIVDLELTDLEEELLEEIQYSQSLRVLLEDVQDSKSRKVIQKDIRHLAQKVEQHINPPSLFSRYKKTIIAFVLGALAVIVLSIRYSPLQERLIFSKSTREVLLPYHYEDPREERERRASEGFFKAKDGTKLSYGFYKRANCTRDILYFHNRSDTVNHTHIKNTSDYLQANVYMLDWRGYGLSHGVITCEQDFYQDSEDFYQYICSISPTNEKIIVGCSLGTSAATYVASKHSDDIAKLVLVGSYTSIYDMVRSWISTPLAWLLMRYELSSFTNIKKVTCPVLLLHGKEDRLFPIKHSEILAKACPSPSITLIKMKGGHLSTVDEGKDEINNFINA